MFDLTVSMGNILNIVAMLSGGLYFLYNIKSEMAVMNATYSAYLQRIASIEDKLEKLSIVIVELARQEERMTSQDIRLQTLALRVEEHFKRCLEQNLFPLSRSPRRGKR